MNKQLKGFLVGEDRPLGRKRWQGVRISVRSPGSLFNYKGYEMAFTDSEDGGRFVLEVRRSPSSGIRKLELVVIDHAGREIPFAPPDSSIEDPRYTVDEQGRAVIGDNAIEETEQFFGELILREADLFGVRTTLGTGNGNLRYSTGNKVTTLMDRDAFECAAAMMRFARQEVLVSQLFFSVPKAFDANPAAETPSMIFDFVREAPGTAIDLLKPRAVQPDDRRPERVLHLTSQRGVDVRILLHAFTVPLFLKIAVGALLFPIFGFGSIFLARDLLGPDLTDTDEVKRYFEDAQAANVKVMAFEQPVLSSGVMHAKLMMMDRNRMLSIGSPFGQSYVDRQDHPIDAWIRGGADSYPKHDAGFTMTGPAHRDFLDTMRLFWDDQAGPDDKLAVEMKDPHFPPMQPPPQELSILDRPEDGVCDVQLVRTLSCDQFGTEQGEKGILEAYLRGIGAAQDFIYLETQYFTNDAIGEALVNVMRLRPGLQVIVLLNIEPDVPTYPFKQRRLITRIRRAIGQTPTSPQRFGVFTRWTHEHAPQLPGNVIPSPRRPRILPVYVHAKVGIIDNEWATVGSANLDGLSLDSSLPSDIFNNLFSKNEQRAIEVNGVFFDNANPPANVVDILRRKLWAEHLGFLKADGTPNIAEPLLQAANIQGGGWLGFWTQRARAALQHVTDNPQLSSAGLARVLPWPEDNSTHKTPRDHLTALGVKPYKVAPLKSTHAFDFKTGKFKEDSKAKMDFD